MNKIQLQFQEMLERGHLPYFEYELDGGEFLLVELNATEKGLEFSADFNDLPCFFDGQIEGSGNFWVLPYDLDLSLDQHLELIDQNIRDGYIIAHSLDVFEI